MSNRESLRESLLFDTPHYLLRMTLAEIAEDTSEVDVYVHESCLGKLLRDKRLYGALVDNRWYNHPHCKVYLCQGDVEYDIILDAVSSVFLFDKSRGVRLCNAIPSDVQKATILRYVLTLLHAAFDKPLASQCKYYDALTEASSLLALEKIDSVDSYVTIPPSLLRVIIRSYHKRKWTLLRWIIKPLATSYYCVSQPVMVVAMMIKKLARLLERLKKRIYDEKIIVFMGVDGSGKSTMINNYISSNSSENWTYVHLGSKSEFLPTTRVINWFRSRRRRSPLIRPNDKSRRIGNNGESRILTALRTTQHTIIHTLVTVNSYIDVYCHIQYLRYRSLLSNRPLRLLVDRYIYDRYTHRMHYYVFALYPKPSILVLMDAPVEILLTRKAEHDVSTTTEFRNRYHRFFARQRLTRAVRVNSVNSISTGRDQIRRIVDQVT